MFENIISIVKTNNTAYKKFTTTKNDVLFDAFEVTCVFQLRHDTKIVVALVESYREAFHTDTGVPMLYIYNKLFVQFILL